MINEYLNYYIGLNMINETDKEKILLLFSDLKTYKETEIFPVDIPLTKYRPIVFGKNKTILKNKRVALAKSIAIDRTNNKLYKMHIIDMNDNYKEIYKINFLREIYFQNIYIELLKQAKIDSIIVPKIHRHGQIELNSTNEIILFIEMTYYRTENIIETSILNELTYIKKKYIIEKYFTLIKKNYNLIYKIERDNDIFHNDLELENQLAIERFVTEELEILNKIPLTEKDEEKIIQKHIEVMDNYKDCNIMVLNEDSSLLIDFEYTYRKHILQEDDIKFITTYLNKINKHL
jgi:hypothetical protein